MEALSELIYYIATTMLVIACLVGFFAAIIYFANNKIGSGRGD
jgi:hypothetical protein